MSTMEDVAREANVSRPTVSFVLNNRDKEIRISKKTRDRVLAAAKKLKYSPNDIARSLVNGYSKILVYIDGVLMHEYSWEIVRGVIDTAQQNNFLLKIVSIDNNSIKNKLQDVLGQRPAGIICRASDKNAVEYISEKCEDFKIPVVFINSSFVPRYGNFMTFDNTLGGQLITEHLLNLGHESILLCGSKGSGVDDFLNDRIKGFRQAHKNAGKTPYGIKTYETYETYKNGLENDVIHMLKNKKRPTAIYCTSDFLALELIRTVTKCGLSIPNDISIAGYGNLHFSSMITPSLTTIDEPYCKIGIKACKEAINGIKNPNSESIRSMEELRMPVSLVVRESTSKIC